MSEKIKPHIYWKQRYDYLKMAIKNLDDKANTFRNEDRKNFPDTCISESNEFWISNDQECFDNETAAKKYAGKGNYFKVIKCQKR